MALSGKTLKGRTKMSHESFHSWLDHSQIERSESDHINYSPVVFLRCHSRNNDSTDKRTSVWQCAFEPSTGASESTVFASCGGNSVCVIDAKDGHVKSKHYSTDITEDFTALAWTSFQTVTGTIKILAVAGNKSVLHLLHPDEPVCFVEHNLKKTSLSLSKGKRSIECMMFHPAQRNILFGAFRFGETGEIHIWDIGTPHPPAYESKIELLQILHTKSPTVALTFSLKTNLLLCATEGGVVGWVCPGTLITRKDKFKDRCFKFPSDSENLAPGDENFVDSIEAIEDGKIIATKCALHGCIYIWDVEDGLGTHVRSIKPLHTLKWSPTDNYYMNIGINAEATILACGDDVGNLWVYDLKEILGHHFHQEHEGSIIEWPEVNDVQEVKQKKNLFNNDSKKKFKTDVVVNKVSFNRDATYLVAVTSTNTVCIWKKDD